MGYLFGIIGLTTSLIGASITSSASALTYQSNIGVNFTFNTSLEVSLSSADLIISELSPGTAADSNVITVNVKTNNKMGYTLTSTVGNATYGNRNLTLKNGTETFASVDYGSTIAANTNLTDNTWAYSYSVDNGTNWVAGSAGNTTAGYSGLPLYTDETNTTTLRTSPGPTSDDGDGTKFKIAARASGTQVSGEYNNVINFNVVAEPEPMTLAASYAAAGKSQFNGYYAMQDLTSSVCEATEVIGTGSALQVLDTRDNNIYWVTKLADNRCWMLDNLALDPTDSTTAANMSENNTNATSAAINNLLNGGNSGGNTGWSNTAVADVDTNFYNGGYTVPRINNASKDTLVTSYGPAATNGQAKVGLYYNYCAASASTYCYESGSGVDVAGTDIDAPQDLCPAQWRMPTGGSYDDSTHTGAGEYYALGTALGLTFDEDEWGFTGNTYQTALSTPLSGLFYFSSAGDQGDWGYWWSSTYGDGSNMYYLDVDPTGVNPGNYGSRDGGYAMRCLVGE